jgi:hypothetical protein
MLEHEPGDDDCGEEGDDNNIRTEDRDEYHEELIDLDD